MVSLRIAGSNRPSEATTRPVGSMNALIPDTAPLIVHRPTSIARSWLNCRCWALARRRPVRGVVHRHHQEPGALAHDLPGDRREGVLEADRHADGRQALDRQWVDLLPRHPVHRDLVDRIDEREPRTERHVLAERHEMDLVVAVDHLTAPVERAVRWCAGSRPDRSARRRRSSATPTELTTPCTAAKVSGSAAASGIERALPPHDQVGRIARPGVRAARCSARRPERPPRPAVAARASRTSTWITATSSGSPSADGERDQHRAGHHRDDRDEADDASVADRRLPPASSAISALTSTTTKVTPHTPATDARRTVSRLSTWLNAEAPPPEAPERPDRDRIHSITVHSAAIADRADERPPRPAPDAARAGRRAPTPPPARCQRRPRQLAEQEDPVDRGAVERQAEDEPQQQPAAAGRASSSAQRKGTSATNAMRPQAGRRERQRQRQAAGSSG